MQFEPDITVTEGDPPSIRLVVEAKLRASAAGEGDAQLKRYMFGMNCFAGLLVTPETIRVYRDSFERYAPESITLVGEFPSPPAIREAAQSRVPRAFERAVADWLQDMRVRFWQGQGGIPEPLSIHVLPSIVSGRIEIWNGPWQRTGTE